MPKPELLVLGPYPEWDMAALEDSYAVHRLWQAQDKTVFLAQHAGRIEAIATRGDLGASAELMRQLPNLKMVAVFGTFTGCVYASIPPTK